MRKGIIYLLMSVFLLFLAENNNNIDWQPYNTGQALSFQLFSFAKKHNHHRTLDKTISKHLSDGVDLVEENDNNLAHHFSSFVIIAILSSVFFSLSFLRRFDISVEEPEESPNSVKKFIFLRSLRI